MVEGRKDTGGNKGLHIQLLGGFVVSVDGDPILSSEWRLRKASSLVKLLAWTPGHRLQRDQLIETLWPESDLDTGINNLHQTIYKARRVLAPAGKDCLLMENGFLSLTAVGERTLTVDIEQFEAAAVIAGECKGPEKYQAALSLYTGDLLPDDLYEEWASARREGLRQIYLRLLLELSQLQESLQQYSAAADALLRLLSADKTHEEAHSGLMRLYSLSGQPQKALKQYQVLREALQTELEVEPSPGTTRLYEDIQSGRVPTPAVVQAPPGPPEKLRKPRHNLPQRLSTFIGREKEIDQVISLLRSARLLTVTGSGGVGKTSLALRAAGYLIETFPNGVWLVELAPLADPELLTLTCARTLEVIEQPGVPIMTMLAQYLENKQLLLILDNVEHIISACSRLVDQLLMHCPKLTILATSREILNLTGENTFRVPSLSLPDLRRHLTQNDIEQSEAVRLFAERAAQASPGFSIMPDNAHAIVQICQQLDGIPLAIELAAARLRLLSVGQIALRLSDAFRLLTGGSRTALPRHQTLQALIGWSFDLLSEKERLLLVRLSIFAGGWTLGAAEAVGVDPDGKLLFEDILDLLGQLADKSLIQVLPSADGDMRYRMLETVRQFTLAWLEKAGEVEDVRSRHLAYYLQLTEGLEPKLRGREQIRTLDYLEGELGNLRLALKWALQTDVEAGLRLAAALQWFWHIRFYWSEGIAWLEQGLEAEVISRGDHPLTGSREVIHANALTALGFHLGQRDQPVPAKAIDSLEEAIAFYRANGPEHHRSLAWALRWLGDCRDIEGNSAQARTLAEEALSLFREIGDLHGMAESLQLLGICEIDLAPQKKIFKEQLAIEQASSDDEGIATALLQIGTADFTDADYVNAFAAFEASQEHYRKVGNPSMVAQDGFFLGAASLFSGNLERAAVAVEEALADSLEIADEGLVAACLFWKGLIAFSQGRYEQVADLYDQSGHTFQKTGEMIYFTTALYLRARLARLYGDIAAARQIAEEGLISGRGLESDKVLMLLELGHLALQDGNMERAGALWRQALIDRRDMFWMSWGMDGLAVLAVREGKMERAARLFGTRQWRGFAHTLSPIERAWRDADLAEVKNALGEERFAQLQAESSALAFEQILAVVQEED